MKIVHSVFLILLSIPAFLYAQFHVDTLARFPEIEFPVAIAFSPDSSHRMFFTEKNSGKVRIMQHDSLLADPFVSLSVANAGEQGAIGVTFDPQYPDSPYVYIFYTRSSDRANLVVRFTDENNTGTDPKTLMSITRLTSAVYHNGGNIHFGPDGKLYVTIGDYAITGNSQDTSRNNRRGKIHRINRDGTIPIDNPTPGSSIYSYGHRNSFDFTFDTLTGNLYASENGLACNDEINLIFPLGNYGWPVDGNCTYSGNQKYKKPIYFWQTNVPAFTGITIYRGGMFPDLYGKMLVTSYNYGAVYAFTLNASGDSITSGPSRIFSYGSGLNDIEVGPDGNIYLTNGTYEGATSLIRLTPPVIVPPSPLLSSPADNSVNQSVQMIFKWHPAAEAGLYHIRVSKDSLFTSLVVDDSTLTDTTTTVELTDYNTTYFWNVRARNNLGTSEYSYTWCFKTIIEKPEIPALVFPHHNSFSRELSIPLQWNSSQRGEMYGVQVASDSIFNLTVIDTQSVVDTMIMISSLIEGSVYYWRVRALNVGGSSAYSSWWKFTANDSLVFTYSLDSRWNIVSTPYRTDDRSKHQLFPMAISDAFSFSKNSGYIVCDTLYPRMGYWMKFDSTQIIRVHGEPVINDTIDVEQGWNLVGSIADTVEVSSIQSIPPGIIESALFDFNNGYVASEIVVPGKGYWIRTHAPGKLVLIPLLQRVIKPIQRDRN